MAVSAAQGEISFEALSAGTLDGAAVDRLAEQLSAAHARMAPGNPAKFRQSLRPFTPLQHSELARHAGIIDRRASAGRIRNIDGSAADILYDLAQALAALLRAGGIVAANRLANRYLDIHPQGASGWALLPLFISLRLEEDAARADAVLATPPARLIVVAGLSGTGKSTLSGLLAPRLGGPAGARILRSDVFRKRLAGVPPETRLPPAHYTRASDEETYEALFESAYDHLGCGNTVILDAVFMSRSERDVVEALAHRARLPFVGFWLDAPERDRIARVTERSGDASDATAEVVREQSRRSVGEIHWHRIRTNRPLDVIATAARGVLERKKR